MKQIISILFTLCPSTLLAQGLPQIDYSDVGTIITGGINAVDHTPPTVGEQLGNDPATLILLALLGVVVIIGYALYAQKGN